MAVITMRTYATISKKAFGTCSCLRNSRSNPWKSSPKMTKRKKKLGKKLKHPKKLTLRKRSKRKILIGIGLAKKRERPWLRRLRPSLITRTSSKAKSKSSRKRRKRTKILTSLCVTFQSPTQILNLASTGLTSTIAQSSQLCRVNSKRCLEEALLMLTCSYIDSAKLASR